jgi:hypothetical protein
MQMSRAKAIVHTNLAWQDQRVSPPVRPVRGIGETGAGLGAGRFGFRAHEDAGFNSFRRGRGGWHGESGRVQFAIRSPPCSFESQKSNSPRSCFRSFRSPPARQGWFFGVFPVVGFVVVALIV